MESSPVQTNSGGIEISADPNFAPERTFNMDPHRLTVDDSAKAVRIATHEIENYSRLSGGGDLYMRIRSVELGKTNVDRFPVRVNSWLREITLTNCRMASELFAYVPDLWRSADKVSIRDCSVRIQERHIYAPRYRPDEVPINAELILRDIARDRYCDDVATFMHFHFDATNTRQNCGHFLYDLAEAKSRILTADDEALRRSHLEYSNKDDSWIYRARIHLERRRSHVQNWSCLPTNTRDREVFLDNNKNDNDYEFIPIHDKYLMYHNDEEYNEAMRDRNATTYYDELGAETEELFDWRLGYPLPE